MVSPSCLGTALAVCLRFRGVVGCGCVVSWFGGSYWWYVSRDLVASRWSVSDVLVQPPQCISVYCAGASWWRLGRACMCVMLCLRVILLVLRCHLSRTFGIFWWCMRGLLLVGVSLVLACRFFGCESAVCERSYGWTLDISMVSCICTYRHAPPTSNNPNISSVFLSLPAELHREKAACVACHKINMCTSHPKQKNAKQPDDFPFSRGLCFFSCGSSTWLSGWRLSASYADPLRSRRAKVLVLLP